MEYARRIKEEFATVEPDITSLLAGTSAQIREVERAVRQLASADVNLLLQGEVGTGKRLLAEAIHVQSRRAAAPFSAVALAERSEAQIEDDLFGPGGGLRDTVHGTTLYLDEVAALPLRLQRRMARALRVPSVRGPVRIIAATAVELEDLVRVGRFATELYFQLALIRLTIPPLRERREDIPALAEHCIRSWCGEQGIVRRITLGRAALAELVGYSWPANLRELQQTITASLALTHGDEISAERVRAVLGRRPRRHAAPDVFPLRQLEHDYIAAVLARCNWNQSLAARRLGIGRNTLMRKIKHYKLDRSQLS
jgi:DNA-binding NtrC family response regulator